jgi:hypothetical protein
MSEGGYRTINPPPSIAPRASYNGEMTNTDKIRDLELKLAAMHEYNRRLLVASRCHDEILKCICSQLGIAWELVELPEPPAPPVN